MPEADRQQEAPALAARVVEILPSALFRVELVSLGRPLATVHLAPEAGLLRVRPGDTVQVLRLPPAGGTGAPAVPEVVVARAMVYASLPDPVQAGATLLTLLVPAEQAAAVAGAGGAGGAALVKVPAK